MDMITIFRLILIFLVCAVLSLQDIKCRKISVPVLCAGYILQLVFIFIEDFRLLFPHLINSVILFVFYLIQSRFIRGKLGFGDILFAAFTGLSIRYWNFLWVSVLIPPVFALIFSFFFYIKTHKFAGVRLPFIPFMSAGLIFTISFEFLF